MRQQSSHVPSKSGYQQLAVAGPGHSLLETRASPSSTSSARRTLQTRQMLLGTRGRSPINQPDTPWHLHSILMLFSMTCVTRKRRPSEECHHQDTITCTHQVTMRKTRTTTTKKSQTIKAQCHWGSALSHRATDAKMQSDRRHKQRAKSSVHMNQMFFGRLLCTSTSSLCRLTIIPSPRVCGHRVILESHYSCPRASHGECIATQPDASPRFINVWYISKSSLLKEQLMKRSIFDVFTGFTRKEMECE